MGCQLKPKSISRGKRVLNQRRDHLQCLPVYLPVLGVRQGIAEKADQIGKGELEVIAKAQKFSDRQIPAVEESCQDRRIVDFCLESVAPELWGRSGQPSTIVPVNAD